MMAEPFCALSAFGGCAFTLKVVVRGKRKSVEATFSREAKSPRVILRANVSHVWIKARALRSNIITVVCFGQHTKVNECGDNYNSSDRYLVHDKTKVKHN